jgi:hypothetical protein
VAEDDDAVKRRDRIQRAAASAGGALAGSIIAGPPGAIMGAGLGPLLEPLAARVWQELTSDGRRRIVMALEATCDAGVPPEDLEARISASERTRLITGYALSGATRTAWEDKVRTLGRSLASGLLAEDDAGIDIEQLITAAIADIEGRQLALLDFLVRWEPGYTVDRPPLDGPLDLPAHSHPPFTSGRWHVRNRAWSLWGIGENRPRLTPVLTSLLGTLQRHGLAVPNDNTGDAIERYSRELESAIGEQYRQDSRAGGFRPRGVPRVTRAKVPEVTWSPTELGEKVLLRFLDAGAEAPDVWTAGPADSRTF